MLLIYLRNPALNIYTDLELDFLTRSEPARSTNEKEDSIREEFSLCFWYIVSIVWLLEDVWFIF